MPKSHREVRLEGVALVRDVEPTALDAFAAFVGVDIAQVSPSAAIPGSFWGEPEAGVRAGTVWVRGDTPLHSLLHEVGHVLCAKAAGRGLFFGDASSDDLEECAVCYLQVLLADRLASVSRARMFTDMDRWGYSFREGSAQRWFFGDGSDGRDWLIAKGLLDRSGQSLVGFGASP